MQAVPVLPAAPVTGVDSHAHVFVRGLPLAAVRRHAPNFDAPLDAYLDLLTAQGLSHGVLVQPSFLGTDNSHLLAALRARPGRLRGVVMLAAETPEEDLHALDALGVRGMRLNLVGLPLPDLRSGAWPALLRQVNALDWHVELHRSASDLPALVHMLLALGCKVVVDHFGRPDTPRAQEAPGFAELLRLAGTRRVWLKLAAAYRSWPRQDDPGACHAAQLLLAHFGADRLVWGSDWPHTQHTQVADFSSAQAALAQWVPDPEARHRILVDTPAALFGIP